MVTFYLKSLRFPLSSSLFPLTFPFIYPSSVVDQTDPACINFPIHTSIYSIARPLTSWRKADGDATAAANDTATAATIYDAAAANEDDAATAAANDTTTAATIYDADAAAAKNDDDAAAAAAAKVARRNATRYARDDARNTTTTAAAANPKFKFKCECK